MVEVDLSKIVTVTLLGTPQGIPNFNVNTLALFTTESPNPSFGADDYKIYYAPNGVATDFGSASETYLQAVAVFAQSPNILTGGGYLVVIPLLTNVAATSGTMITLEPGELDAIKAVNDGALKITVDGADQTLTGMDFTSVTSYADVATIIDGELTGANCAYNPAYNSGAGGFIFTSATTGASSTVSKLKTPASGTDISGVTYLNGTGNVQIVNGRAASSAEDLVSAIVRTKLLVDYFGILSITQESVGDLENLATYVQTQDKLSFLGRYDTAEIETIFKYIHDNSLSHTRMLLYTLNAQKARIAAAAYASRLQGINFTGSNTMCTMNLKALAGIEPDPDAAESNIDVKAQAYGFDIYVSIAGDPGVLSYGANVYSDEIYGELWLKLALQVAGYNYLKTTNTKIPQTEPGMSGLKGAYATVCQQGITNGFLASGLTWTSPSTFGNPEDLRRNIKDAGYYIYSLPIVLQSPADRTARKAPLIQIAVKMAGAIHHSDVIVQVN